MLVSEVLSNRLDRSQRKKAVIVASPTSTVTTKITSDQALCNLALLVVLRDMWEGPFSTDFNAKKAAIQQLEILDDSISTMDLDELIKLLDNLNDMGDFTDNLEVITEDEIGVIEKITRDIYEGFENNAFTATAGEYAEAIQTLDLMYKDIEGWKPGFEILERRMAETHSVVSPESCTCRQVLIAYSRILIWSI